MVPVRLVRERTETTVKNRSGWTWGTKNSMVLVHFGTGSTETFGKMNVLTRLAGSSLFFFSEISGAQNSFKKPIQTGSKLIKTVQDPDKAPPGTRKAVILVFFPWSGKRHENYSLSGVRRALVRVLDGFN